MYTQKGYGNILGTLMRTGTPLVNIATKFLKSRAGRKLGRGPLLTGSKIVGEDVKGKRTFKASVRKHGKEAVKSGFQALLESKSCKEGVGTRRRNVGMWTF